VLCPPKPGSEEKHHENSLVHHQYQSHSTEPMREDGERERERERISKKKDNAHFILITNCFTQVISAQLTVMQ